jgi:hypothetical protein
MHLEGIRSLAELIGEKPLGESYGKKQSVELLLSFYFT